MKNLKKVLSVICLCSVCITLFACNSKGDSASNGKKIVPLYTEVDMKNLPDGIYHVGFDSTDLTEKNDDIYLNMEISSEDLYDVVDVHNIAVGDTVVYGAYEEKVEKIAWDEQKSKLAINVDKFEDNIWYLHPSDQGGTYYIVGPDDHHTYTKRGESNVKISKNCVVKDDSNVILGGNEINLEYDNIVNYINNTDNFNFLNTSAMVENGEIIEIKKWYIP